MIPATAQIIRDSDGWYLRWQDGDLYWVTVDLVATNEDAALEEARDWISRSTHLDALTVRESAG